MRRRVGRTIRQGYPDPDQLAARLLEAAGNSGPPTDLDAVIDLWKGLKKRELELDKAGYLIPLPAVGAELVVRRSDPSTRKSFTVAHELGHWTLSLFTAGALQFEPPYKVSSRGRECAYTPDEQWCNGFAGALLIPRDHLVAYLRLQEGLTADLPKRVLEGPRIFNVSEDAFFQRVVRATPISILEFVPMPGRVVPRRRYVSPSLTREAEALERICERLAGKLTGEESDSLLFPDVAYQPYHSGWIVCVAPTTSADRLCS